jgi:ParB family chromosome partitioning protein
MGHARALLGLADDAARVRLAKLITERGYSVRETEDLVRKALKREAAAPAKPSELPVVSQVLKTRSVRVELRQKASGKGKLIVQFADAEARDAIVLAIKSAMGSAEHGE